ncbi:hypothetical protein KGQ71_04095 [Patescibacteria group bacterium]|nr:hypothetical protein [Patescibacteria group bacterium]
MNHTFALQYCRIVAPEKLSDRFLVSGVLHQKENELLGDQVILAYVIEVTKPWFPSSKVLPSLLEIIYNQHQQLTPGKNIDDQFELLLRNLNEQLNAISEQGETDWIGNLNGLILVMCGDELHFSQTGRSPAYILQKNRIRQITDENTQEGEPHPLKTFSNLASGMLQEGDHILVSNSELYREISLDALRRIMNNNSPAAACSAIVKELKREKNPAVSTLILKIISKGEVENQKTPEPTEIILEEEFQSRFRKIQKQLTPVFLKVGHQSQAISRASVTTAKKTGTLIQKNVAPVAGTILHKGLEQAHHLKKQVASQRSINSTPTAMVEIILPRKERERLHNESVAKAAEERLDQQYNPDEYAELPVEPQESSPLIARLAPLLQWIAIPRNKKISALVVAVILIVVTAWAATVRRLPHSTDQTNDRAVTLLQQASSLQKTAANSMASGQSDAASKDIQQAESIINALTTLSDSQKSQAESIWQTLTSESDSLSKTTRLASASATYSFSGSGEGLIAHLPYFYSFSNNVPGLLRTGSGDPSQVKQTVNLPDTTDWITAIIKSNESDTAAYALTHSNKVYRITQTESVTAIQPVSPASGDFATGDSIGTFNGNIYILDSKNGLLWKYLNTGTAYQKGVSVIDNNRYDIKHSVSLAIDGAIYFLKADGSVTKFISGQQQSFSLKGQPYLAQKLTQPTQIITSENMDDIYVLDTGVSSALHSTARVLVFDKNGNYIKEYGFPENYTQVQAFDIDPTAKKLWILNDSQVSEFDI